MELSAGYKNTEVGVIPEDWEVKTLGELVDKIIGGGTPSRSNKEFWGNEIPWVTVKDFATFNPNFTQEFITKKGLENSASHLISKGTLITSTRMGLGKAVIYDVDVSINQDLKAIFTSKSLDTNYLYYWFQKNSELIERLGSGSTVMGISLTELKNIQFTLPTKTEQTAIATALSDADALISSLEKLIAKKRNIKQGAMQKLLQPKEGWEVKKLEEIIKSIQLGGNYPNSETTTSFPLIKMGNIQRGFISTDKIEYIIGESIPEKRDKLNYSDVLFNTRNTLELVGKVAIWKDELVDAYFNSNLMRLEFNPVYISSNFFMNFIFNTKDFISKLKDIATGTTSVAAIYSRDLLKVEISFPNREEQTHIATILLDMDNEINALEAKLEKYRKVKLGMMQNLLTGKIRLI